MPKKSIPTLLLEYVDGQDALSQIRRSIKAEDRTPVRLAYIWNNGLKSKDRPLWKLVEQAAKKRYGMAKHKSSGGYKWREKYRRAEKAWMGLVFSPPAPPDTIMPNDAKPRGADIPVTLLMPPDAEQWRQAFKNLKSRNVPKGFIEARIEEVYG